jgi:hypothetical protein
MEAPEKIYIDDPTGEFNDHWSVYQNDDSVEYTRTDAFIGKACDAYCKVCGHYAHSVPTHICRHDCRYFSDFKNYMKGE